MCTVLPPAALVTVMVNSFSMVTFALQAGISFPWNVIRTSLPAPLARCERRMTPFAFASRRAHAMASIFGMRGSRRTLTTTFSPATCGFLASSAAAGTRQSSGEPVYGVN